MRATNGVNMRVGMALLDRARASGARSIVVIGTGKNVGKTVAVRAIAQAAHARGLRLGLTSTGRDGEGVDIVDAMPKPRLFLRAGDVLATARGSLPDAPATEVLDVSKLATAAGSVAFVRVRADACYEIVGPPTAAGVRSCIDRFFDFGCELAIVDGAVDRVAVLAGGDDAVVVATGAADASTLDEAVADVQALVRRLSVPAYDAREPFVRIDGALTPTLARALAQARDQRQIVVMDPTQIAITGHTFLGVNERLRLRCERPLRVVAVTAASIGRERYFEPHAFARAVAEATGLPVYDVYAASAAA